MNQLKSLVIAMLGLALMSPVANTQEHVQRSITVSGQGEVSVAPDLARVSMSVIERDKAIDTAQSKTGAVTNAVLQLTDKLGIDRAQVNTTSASVRPDYRWNRDTEQQELLGYVAERRIQVEVRDLDKLPELIEGAVDAGVNNVSPPSLDTTGRRDAERKALANAADDARANAQTLADSLGVKLGEVLSANEAGTVALPMPMVRATMADSAESGQSYNAGEIKFNASVTVTYGIK